MKLKLTVISSLLLFFIFLLSTCTLGGSVEEILENANSDKLIFTLIDDETAYSISVRRYIPIYNGNYKLFGNVIIPASHNDKPVARIESFSNNSAMTSITIPSSVTSISYGAFYNCNILTRVFYGGADSTVWSGITIHGYSSQLTYATRYYYCDTHPGTANTHWRWVDGAPTVWN
ncbi:MAG: leucine-rich repeat domain-containing protein [Treponema sp.]|nr:leucine-rich repeat domain-containing protein [Treponema sp.]